MGDSDQAMWERPWTTNELRQNSDNWTLAGDAGLLNHLQKLSESLLSRTHEVQKEVDSLVRETKLTNARMGIAVNDFLMLSNTQFVENRVYDEEVQEDTPTEEKKQDEQEKTKEQREQELIPRITNALRKGLLVVNEAFEKIDSTESENESEVALDASYQKLPLLQPKDYYQHRPLPHIIGSDRFMRDDTVGLGEVVSVVEVAESEYGSEKSVAESKEEKSEEGTDDVSASEEDYPQQAPSKISSIISSSNEWAPKEDNGSDGEDLFSPDGKLTDGEVDSESEEEITIATANRNGPVDFASELAAKLNITARPARDTDSEIRKPNDTMESKRRSVTKDEGSSHASSRKPSRKNSDVAVKSKVPNTVPVETEEEEADNSPFSKKGGLFSGGGGLFDDLNDEDSDLFSDVPKAKNKSKKEPIEDKSSRNRTRSSRKSSSGSTGAFEDDADLFVKRKESKASAKNEPAVKTTVPKKGLFDNDDEEDDDEDLFSKLATRKTSTKSEVSLNDRKNTASSLFGEENGLSKGSSKPPVEKEKSVSSKESTPRKKKPAGAVSMFGPGVNPLAAAIRAHHRMSDSDKEDVDDEWSDTEKTRPGSRSSKSSVSATSSKVESKLASRSNSVSSNSTSLFAEEVESSDLFTSAEKDTKPKIKPIGGVSLFDDDFDDDDDLFSTASIAKLKSPEKSTKMAPKNRTSDKSDAQNSLFGGTTSKARKSSGPQVNSREEQPDVSVDVVAKPKERDKLEEEKSKAPKKVSLFDEDDEEADASDLFVSPAKLSQDKDNLKEPVVKVRSRSLFDDEDVLFGGPQEEAPSVDLFKTGDADSSQKGHAHKKRSESKTSHLDELFEDAEDDDLFPNKSKDAKALGKPPIPTPRKASLPKEESKSTTNDEQSLQGEPDKAVESSPLPVTKNNQDETDMPSPKKKPIGGVSLFGGLDPFGSKISRSRSNSEVVESTSKGSPKKEAAVKATPPSSPTSSDSIVMKRPSLKDTKEASVSFDDPAEANTLHSANKERAKIQVKRRPPSRKGRQDAFRKSGIFVDDDTDSKASIEEASSSSFTSSPLTPEGGDGFMDVKRRTDPSNSVPAGNGKECSIMSPSTEEDDMFAIGDHVGLMTHIPERTSINRLNVEDDLFTNDTSSKTNSSEESSNIFGADDVKKDAQIANVLNFSDKKSKNHKVTNSASSTVSKSKVQVNDIFEDGSSNDEDLFLSSDSRRKSLPKSNAKYDNDDDDDLFSSASKPSTKKPPSVDLFADDDDLFNPKTIKVEKSKSKLEANSLFADEPKDDIFADLKPTKKTAGSASLTSKSSASKRNDSKKNVGKSIFDDDDDDDTVDLFNDPALVKKK